MDNQQKLEAARRLVKVVCDYPYGDGEVVMDLGIGYADKWNGDEVWVTGNWNDRFRSDRIGRRIKDETPGRLFDALERIGVNGEWYDEFDKCCHCGKLFRTKPDSYSWKPYFVSLNDGDMMCGDCVLDPDFFDDVLNEFVNNPERVVAFCDDRELIERGWSRFNTEHQFENGWHPGQTDNPRLIFEQIEKEFSNHDILFWLDENSQFYIGFSAFIKPQEREETDYVGFDTGRGE